MAWPPALRPAVKLGPQGYVFKDLGINCWTEVYCRAPAKGLCDLLGLKVGSNRFR
jgi:hypothetical protein